MIVRKYSTFINANAENKTLLLFAYEIKFKSFKLETYFPYFCTLLHKIIRIQVTMILYVILSNKTFIIIHCTNYKPLIMGKYITYIHCIIFIICFLSSSKSQCKHIQILEKEQLKLQESKIKRKILNFDEKIIQFRKEF